MRRERDCNRRLPSSSARYSTGRWSTLMRPSAFPPMAQANPTAQTSQLFPALGGDTSSPKPSGMTPGTAYCSGGNSWVSSQAPLNIAASGSSLSLAYISRSSSERSSTVTRPYLRNRGAKVRRGADRHPCGAKALAEPRSAPAAFRPWPRRAGRHRASHQGQARTVGAVCSGTATDHDNRNPTAHTVWLRRGAGRLALHSQMGCRWLGDR